MPAAVWRPLKAVEVFARERDAGALVQIGETFERMTFVVRDLARESSKKIIVQLSGA